MRKKKERIPVVGAAGADQSPKNEKGRKENTEGIFLLLLLLRLSRFIPIVFGIEREDQRIPNEKSEGPVCLVDFTGSSSQSSIHNTIIVSNTHSGSTLLGLHIPIIIYPYPIQSTAYHPQECSSW